MENLKDLEQENDTILLSTLLENFDEWREFESR